MSAPAITSKRTVDVEVINLYVEDAAQPGTGAAAEVAGLLAAYVDVYLVGADTCHTIGRETLMTSKIRQAYELIEALPCLCHDNDPWPCARCHAIGDDTPHHATAKSATATAQIIARTLVQHGLFADVDSARYVAGLITMALWKEQKLIGSNPADTTHASLESQLTRTSKGTTKMAQPSQSTQPTAIEAPEVPAGYIVAGYDDDQKTQLKEDWDGTVHMTRKAADEALAACRASGYYDWNLYALVQITEDGEPAH